MTRTRLRKVVADFLVRPTRTLLTLLGLSVGLFGVGAVLIAFTILANDLDENFARSLPANVVVQAGPVDDATISRLRSVDGVTAVEDRPRVPSRLEIGLGNWLPMSLYVVRDFRNMSAARIFPEQGAWPPAAGTLLIERSGRFWLREQPGVDVNVRIGGGEPFSVPLAGFAFDPGQAPSGMDRIMYGYVTPETYRAWTGSEPPSRLLLRVDTARVSAAAAAAAAARTLRASGVRVDRVESFESLEHPHQFQLNSVVAILGALACFSLLMCAVLTVNLVEAVMAHERRSIGVMRAIGAGWRQIASDYLLGVALLGFIAGAISLPLALRTGRGIAGFVAGVINFDLLTPEGPGWLIPFVLGVAILVPMLVATFAILRAARMPVRDTLARAEPGQKAGLGEGAAWLLRPLPLLQRIAARSLARRPRRALLTALVMALGVAFFMTALNTRSSMLATVDEARRIRPYDINLTLGAPQPVAEIATWLSDFPQISRFEPWVLAEASMASANGAAVGNPTPLYGVPSGSTSFRPELIDGRWLDPRAPAGIAVTQGMMNENPRLRIGERYRLRRGEASAAVELIGVVKEFGAGRIYAPLPVLRGLGVPEGRSNHLLLTLRERDPGAQRRTISELEESVAGSGWTIAAAVETHVTVQIVVAHLEDIGMLLAFIAGIALAIGGLGLASSISIGVVERYREIAVLKAIGAKASAIAAIFVGEAVMIGLLGAGLAVLVATPLSRAVADRFGTLMIEYPFDYRAADYVALMGLAVAVATALVACLLPVRSAIRLSVKNALHTE